jgi:hypothetical protein
VQSVLEQWRALDAPSAIGGVGEATAQLPTNVPMTAAAIMATRRKFISLYMAAAPHQRVSRKCASRI